MCFYNVKILSQGEFYRHQDSYAGFPAPEMFIILSVVFRSKKIKMVSKKNPYLYFDIIIL
jgi:hypothetical protein